ncbi:MAG: 16S rRNA (adenine(1518)-N(6)/adenine(1519)-N(6))-dimethyltransferase RsmA [Alphaproteobacteria bacterium]
MIDKIKQLPSLQETVKEFDLAPKKSLGQNFLFDMNITTKIAGIAGDLNDINVIEIGSGPGGLTRALLMAGANVTCVEADPRAVSAIQPLKDIAGDKLNIINADATKTDITKIGTMPRQVIANLPYNVGTVLLTNWLEIPNEFTKLTLMFQKEVAERISASVGEKHYGRLAILCNLLCHTSIEMILPPSAFTPPPKVDSAVVSLTIREKPLYECNVKTVSRVTKMAFGQRRKMIRASLKQLGVDTLKLLKMANIVETKRAEELTIEEFCRLANTLDNNF